MSRKRREVPLDGILHIVNRGNDKRVIFVETLDYADFLVLLREAREHFGVQLLAYCLMPNHFHLVVRVENLKAISAYMLFVQREHACYLRARARTKGQGHVFQRRYWSKVIEGDGHLMTVMRYVEANPVRGCLVDRAEAWEWSSLWDRYTGERDLLHAAPWRLPEEWNLIVNTPLQAPDLCAIRRPLKVGRPSTYDSRKRGAGPLWAVNGSDCSTMGSDPSAPPARGQTPV